MKRLSCSHRNINADPPCGGSPGPMRINPEFQIKSRNNTGKCSVLQFYSLSHLTYFSNKMTEVTDGISTSKISIPGKQTHLALLI